MQRPNIRERLVYLRNWSKPVCSELCQREENEQEQSRSSEMALLAERIQLALTSSSDTPTFPLIRPLTASSDWPRSSGFLLSSICYNLRG